MKISLTPAALKRAASFAYAAYTIPLPAGSLGDLVARSAAYAGGRAVFAAADQSLTLFGAKPLRVWQDLTPARLRQIQQELQPQWVDLTPGGGVAPCLMGGLPFDLAGQPAKFWADLATGYVILPQLLFKQTPTGKTVTLLAPVSAHLAADLQELADQVSALLVADRPVSAAPPAVTGTELAVADWMQLVDRSVAAIQAGQLRKVVLARQLAVTTGAHFDPVAILHRLAAQQVNTYRFLVESPQRAFVGATPERLVKATATEYLTASVAGSAPRGATPAADQQLGAALLADPKNQVEHQIVVQRIAKLLAPYTTAVTIGARQLLKNRDIQHIYHPLAGPRQAGSHLLDVVAALHPTPALGGEPRAAALAWLREHEAGRGLYGAPVGWLSLGADEGEFVVGLRSGVFSAQAGRLYAGCGIVAASHAATERAETRLKFQPMLRGISDSWTIKRN